MSKKRELLSKHPYAIWHNEKEDRWYTDILIGDTKKRIKRKSKDDLENVIVEYAMTQEEKNKARDVSNNNERTVEELFYEFMNYKSHEVGSGTIRRMMIDWRKFYEPYDTLIKKPFTDVTKIDIDIFFNYIMDQYHLKRKAFYNVCGIIKQMYEYAIDCEYVDKSPYRNKVNKKKFTSDRKKPSESQVYTEKEKQMLLCEMERRFNNYPSSTACLAVMLFFELGVRRGEMLAISKGDICNGRIHIHRQLVEEYDTSDLKNIRKLGYKVVEYTKSDDGDRWLPLTEQATKIIQRVIDTNAKYGYAYKDFLFVRGNSILTPETIDAQIDHGCENIGIPVKSMHKIRKSYASRLYHNGVNISIVKDMLGHADEAITIHHYIYNPESEESTYNIVKNALDQKKWND